MCPRGLPNERRPPGFPRFRAKRRGRRRIGVITVHMTGGTRRIASDANSTDFDTGAQVCLAPPGYPVILRSRRLFPKPRKLHGDCRPATVKRTSEARHCREPWSRSALNTKVPRNTRGGLIPGQRGKSVGGIAIHLMDSGTPSSPMSPPMATHAQELRPRHDRLAINTPCNPAGPGPPTSPPNGNPGSCCRTSSY
jgi:hypothetical protein